MTLLEFYENHNGSQRRRVVLHEVAKECGTTTQYLYSVAHGYRKASPILARRIERATKGVVTKEDIRPDIFGEDEFAVA